MTLTNEQEERIRRSLASLEIEVPSWAFANTGTRFGKFLDPGAATTLSEKLSDAGQVHKLTGSSPRVAVHVLWNLPNGEVDAAALTSAAEGFGVQVGSINPNVFEGQEYKHGSLGNGDPEVRQRALDHILECVRIGQACGSRDVSLWFGDGSNYPGTANIRHRRRWFSQGLQRAHEALSKDQRLLVEYKPFEPAFYHTDIADWGMALLLAREAGSRARVLVDTGHHYQAQNVEQIVAWLLEEEMLGGFHFNDRRYADDDLTLGSIDPYQVFRIFHEIHSFAHERGAEPDIAYMVDQSHNLKPKVAEMIQTVMTAQELFAKAALVDHEKLQKRQAQQDLIGAEEILKRAFHSDVVPALQGWRRSRGLPEDPLEAFLASGYREQAVEERAEKNRASGGSYA